MLDPDLESRKKLHAFSTGSGKGKIELNDPSNSF